MLTFMTDTLAAKQAITEVLYRYCRGLDRMDRALALSVWHADGTARYEEWFDGTGAAFVDWVWRVHAEVLRHSNQITNVLIEVDGDRAVSESYVTVCLRTKPHEGGATDIESRGRYLDRWSRRDGRWAIEHRQYVDDIMHTVAVPDDAAAAITSGHRDRDDPSYAFLT